MVAVPSGESVWRRDDVTNVLGEMMFTDDSTGVVAMTVAEEMLNATGNAIAIMLPEEIRGSLAESPSWWGNLLDDFAYGLPNPDGQLFVIEASTGDTRFVLENSHWEPAIPVVKDGVVREVLRLNHFLKTERVSLTDGAAEDAANLGISSLGFAVASGAKDAEGVYVVTDGKRAGGAVGYEIWRTCRIRVECSRRRERCILG